MDKEAVTRQIEDAWAEVRAEQEQETAGDETQEVPAVEEPEEDAGDEDSEAEVEGEEEDAGESEEDEEAEEESEDEDEEEEPVEDEQDLEVQAFLAKYDGDVDAALKGAAGLYHVVGRQGSEKAELQRQLALANEELRRAKALGGTGPPLTEEQRGWVEEAVSSGNPAHFIQQAVDAHEFDLARAICYEWAREDPANAVPLRIQIDGIEQQVRDYVPPIDREQLLTAIADSYPDVRAYEQEMVIVMQRLGENHPLVQDARSDNVPAAITGVLGIYEIARASSKAVRSARDSVRERARQNGESAKAEAVVSSVSTASPASAGTPKGRQEVLPGLTLEDLQAEFERANAE